MKKREEENEDIDHMSFTLMHKYCTLFLARLYVSRMGIYVLQPNKQTIGARHECVCLSQILLTAPSTYRMTTKQA